METLCMLLIMFTSTYQVLLGKLILSLESLMAVDGCCWLSKLICDLMYMNMYSIKYLPIDQRCWQVSVPSLWYKFPSLEFLVPSPEFQTPSLNPYSNQAFSLEKGRWVWSRNLSPSHWKKTHNSVWSPLCLNSNNLSAHPYHRLHLIQIKTHGAFKRN